MTKESFMLLSEKCIFPWPSNSAAAERKRFGEELRDVVLPKGTDLDHRSTKSNRVDGVAVPLHGGREVEDVENARIKSK